VRRTIGYLVAGLASGAGTKAVDDFAGRMESVTGAVLSALGSAPALWMLIVVGIAMLERRSMWLAAVRGSVFFIGLGAGYYGYSEVMLGFSGVGLVLFWMVAGVVSMADLLDHTWVRSIRRCAHRARRSLWRVDVPNARADRTARLGGAECHERARPRRGPFWVACCCPLNPRTSRGRRLSRIAPTCPAPLYIRQVAGHPR
jgi:hypothetical protein